MAKFEAPEDRYDVADARFGVVASRFNESVVQRLLEGATTTLSEQGVPPRNVTVVLVPGAFELPLAAQRLAGSGAYDALIALGAVIRGGTPHFEYVAGQCASGIMQVSLEQDIPISFGVLTVDTIAQAMERAGGSEGNKGHEAALAAIEMVHRLRGLKPR